MVVDPEKRLKKIVLKTGEVNSSLHGFEIRVIYPALFPWHQVIDQLIEIGQEVRISKKANQICVISEPDTG
jgi:hypothetical protein